MALQTSGAISLANIQTEFGGSNPISLSEYYGAAAGVPTSGTINIGHFYGKSSQFTFTISANTSNANLASLATAAGWDGSSNLQATINSGVYVYSTSTGTPALTISGSFPAGVTLINNGYIVGRGGNGGAGRSVSGFSGYGGSNGGTGGNALTVSTACTVENNGTIAGGGGGGGGGRATYKNVFIGDWNTYYHYGGSGGGGGRTGLSNSSGGAGGAASGGAGGSAGIAGGAGTSSSAGAGGGGYGGFGGNGGNWGAGGATGGYGSGTSVGGPYAGGGGGSAVSGNSNITWTATGTRTGAIA